jgi:hypothetical protein
MTDSPLSFALRYNELGWGVLACPLGGKRPDACLAPRGVYSATRDRETLRELFGFTARNVAIAVAEDICVVDIDPRSGGIEAMAALVRENGDLPLTPRQRSGSGGVHLLFKRARGSLRGKIASGIDLLGSGKYFIATPSIHACGKPYVWLVAPWDCAIAPMPAWLEARAVRSNPTKLATTSIDHSSHDKIARARRYVERLPGAVSGSDGHRTAFVCVMKIVRGFAIDNEDLLLDLLASWNARCDPPWSEHELRHKIRQALSAGTLEWGSLGRAGDHK